MDCSLPGSSSLEFSRQEYWSGLQWPPPGDLPSPGIEPSSLLSPELAGMFFTTNTTWEAPTLCFYWSRILGACSLSKGAEKKKTRLVLSRSSSVSHPCFRPYHLLHCWKQSRTSLISPLKDWRLELKLQYFGYLMQWADSLEKTLILGKIEGKRRREQQRMRWLDGITDSKDMDLSKLWKTVEDRGVWRATVYRAAKSQTWLSDRTITRTPEHSIVLESHLSRQRLKELSEAWWPHASALRLLTVSTVWPPRFQLRGPRCQVQSSFPEHCSRAAGSRETSSLSTTVSHVSTILHWINHLILFLMRLSFQGLIIFPGHRTLADHTSSPF